MRMNLICVLYNLDLCILPALYSDIVIVYFQCTLPFTIEEVKFYLHIYIYIYIYKEGRGNGGMEETA